MLMMLAFRGPNGKKFRADADDARATVGKENMPELLFLGHYFNKTMSLLQQKQSIRLMLVTLVVPTIRVILFSPSSTKSLPADTHDARCRREFFGNRPAPDVDVACSPAL